MANESIRIRTTVGTNQNLRFKLEQDFDFLEILSLKISQEDLYQTFCSNYGVVVGRVIANKGFGVPNAKVSVFVPITSEDRKNDLIKDFYPFKTPYQKNSDGIRYNLLLSKTTCGLNKAVGTFPTKEEVLDNDIMLEIFDSYYKYTTKTNDSGDYMIFGVPVGSHTIHMDVDLSDAGVASIRPYDLIDDGYPEKLFASRTQFKGSSNLDTLPQIKSGNIGADVIPFWGDPESCEIGITRVDFDTNFEIKTNSVFFGSIFTDSGKMSLNLGCNPKNDMGEEDNLRTGAGVIDMIRVGSIDQIDWFNNGKITPVDLEEFSVNGSDLIDDNGTFAFTVPMNIGHVITDEFGNTIPSADPSVGVATKGMYRFKMKFIEPPENPKFRTATIFFPSLGESFGGTKGMVDTGNVSDANGTQDQRWTSEIGDYDTTVHPNSRIFLDFHTFEWKQLYTIAHYIKKYKKGANRFSFLGIKNTDISAETNLFPFTNAIWKFDILYYILAFFIDAVAFLLKILVTLISLCIGICSKGISITILKEPYTIIPSFCVQVCPFNFLGDIIGTIFLPCEGAPNDGYEISLGDCSTNFCSNQPIQCSTDLFYIGTNIDSINTNGCLGSVSLWQCCVKYNLTENRNVMRRVFNDAWVFGTAYLFQFKYKKKKNGGEKFCGPGSAFVFSIVNDSNRSTNYKKNQCCIDTKVEYGCAKCLLRGPNKSDATVDELITTGYHFAYHNLANHGAKDVDDIIYCNALMSTKIISLGRIEMCQETLEQIETATLAGQALHQYAQDPLFYTGTFFENGWDSGYWVNYLKESSYEDPRDVFLYLLLNKTPNCNPRDMFHGGGLSGYPCHEYELKDDSYFLVKEVSKIYTDTQLSDVLDEDLFNPVDGSNPYADMSSSTITNGGFIVDLEVASRFSPCGNKPSNCVGKPGYKWVNNPSISPDTGQATNNVWDNYNSQGDRNNPNTRSNIPYYYFGINPGKTAVNRLRKDYFTPLR